MKSNSRSRNVDIGDIKLRMIPTGSGFVGRAYRGDKPLGEQISGESADSVWMKLHDLVSKSDPRYFGFDGATARFLKNFPQGFEDQRYVTDERNYKLQAATTLQSISPADVGYGKGFRDTVLSAINKTDLLHMSEKIAITDLLRSELGAAYVQAAAKFTLEPSAATIAALAAALAPTGKANWVLATYLPFLWEPDRHMFLKPGITREFSARVGHRFDTDYANNLVYPVYASLLDLVDRTRTELAALKPRDNIDIHSFIFVVGKYPDLPDYPA
jgi:hypothetical protein